MLADGPGPGDDGDGLSIFFFVTEVLSTRFNGLVLFFFFFFLKRRRRRRRSRTEMGSELWLNV